MDKPARKLEWLVWGLLALTIVAIAVTFVVSRQPGKRADSRLPLRLPLPDFQLTNQFGRPITLANLRGQVWVADIVFTRCAGPCPEMTRKMSVLQEAFPREAPVKFITLTTDPAFDTPQVLRAYAQRFEAQTNRWHFLTGTTNEIRRLAVTGLKLASVEKGEDEREHDRDLFIHSTLFVIVDQAGNLRAVVESDDPEMRSRIVAAVEALLEGRRGEL